LAQGINLVPEVVLWFDSEHKHYYFWGKTLCKGEKLGKKQHCNA
jgi:hypothetical protein